MEPKTALAGVILEISFARFVASMVTFSEERMPPRPLGLSAQAQLQKSGDKSFQRIVDN